MHKTVKTVIAGLFIFIFAMKMTLSIAPVFISFWDTSVTKAAIMQIEVEHDKEDAGKKGAADKKAFADYCAPGALIYYGIFILKHASLQNLPYTHGVTPDVHLRVPTPPPDLA